MKQAKELSLFRPITSNKLSLQSPETPSTSRHCLPQTSLSTITNHQQQILFDYKVLICSSTTVSVWKPGLTQRWRVLVTMHRHRSQPTPCQQVKPPSITKECSLTNCASRSPHREQQTSTSCPSRCTSQMRYTVTTQLTTSLCLRTTTMTITMITTTTAMTTSMITTTMETMMTMMTMTTAITT